MPAPLSVRCSVVLMLAQPPSAIAVAIAIAVILSLMIDLDDLFTINIASTSRHHPGPRTSAPCFQNGAGAHDQRDAVVIGSRLGPSGSGFYRLLGPSLRRALCTVGPARQGYSDTPAPTAARLCTDWYRRRSLRSMTNSRSRSAVRRERLPRVAISLAVPARAEPRCNRAGPPGHRRHPGRHSRPHSGIEAAPAPAVP